jgi:hypothetical protein
MPKIERKNEDMTKQTALSTPQRLPFILYLYQNRFHREGCFNFKLVDEWKCCINLYTHSCIVQSSAVIGLFIRRQEAACHAGYEA